MEKKSQNQISTDGWPQIFLLDKFSQMNKFCSFLFREFPS